MTHGARRQRFRLRLLAAFLLLMTIPYARQTLVSPTAGQDFRVFFAAATVIAEHGNPYDWTSLGRAEDRLYDQPKALKPGDPAYYDFLPYPEGPWLAFGLVPLTGLPWQAADAVYATLLLAVLVGASYLTFTLLGWERRRALVAAVLTGLSPICFINLFMGQVSGLVFGGFAGAWWLARRGHAWAAGLLLTSVWLKPNIGLVLPLVLSLLLAPALARRMLAWFMAGTSIAFAAAAIVLRDGFLDWPLQVPRMWQAVQGVQPDIASVESFLYPGLSGWPKSAVLIITLAAAAAYAIWVVSRTGGYWRALSLLLIWLAALPFVQSYDMILLLPLAAVLLGSELIGWTDPLVEITIWAFVSLPLCYFLGFRVGYFNGFTAIPLALLLIAWHHRLQQQRSAERREAVAA